MSVLAMAIILEVMLGARVSSQSIQNIHQILDHAAGGRARLGCVRGARGGARRPPSPTPATWRPTTPATTATTTTPPTTTTKHSAHLDTGTVTLATAGQQDEVH